MTWFKVDDQLHDHRKARKAGKAAMGVWVLAGSWSAENLTDGFIPADVALRWGTKADARRLVDAGLWSPDEYDGENGWRFHDWAQFQPSAAVNAAIKEERRQAGQSGNHKRWHVDRGLSDPDCDLCIADPIAVAIADPIASEVANSSPVPVPVPDPENPSETSSHSNPRPIAPDRFEEWWDVYDHKQGKKKARHAYSAALKKPGVTDELLIESARAYVAWQRSEGKHPTYTKHPTTWLHGEHWADERPGRRATNHASNPSGIDWDAAMARAQARDNAASVGPTDLFTQPTMQVIRGELA